MKQDILTQIMAFAHSLAHYLGTWIVALLHKILPMVKELSTLADPIGYLAILSLFVIRRSRRGWPSSSSSWDGC